MVGLLHCGQVRSIPVSGTINSAQILISRFSSTYMGACEVRARAVDN